MQSAHMPCLMLLVELLGSCSGSKISSMHVLMLCDVQLIINCRHRQRWSWSTVCICVCSSVKFSSIPEHARACTNVSLSREMDFPLSD